MSYAVISPLELCQLIEQQISEACISDKIWKDGITTGYGLINHPIEDKGCMEVLPGYEKYFLKYDDKIQYVDDLTEDWFPKLTHI